MPSPAVAPMPPAQDAGEFFVPHDLRAPLAGAASGPLAGLTFALKDMYDIAGERVGGGNPDWLANQEPARSHAPVVAALLDAGGTLIGKTICDEFFYSVTGINAHYGAPANLRAPGRMPGGSSSGSAAAVAAGCCDFALGSDTGGSVRIPAAFCGLYGIRPTFGRVDLTGVMGMAQSFDVAGWFAATPGVFRQVGGVLLKGERVDAAIGRMIVADDAFAAADAEVGAVIARALQRAASLLPEPQRQTVAPDGFDDWREAFRLIQGREVWGLYEDFVARCRPRLGPGIAERFEAAARVTAAEAATARHLQAEARAYLRALVPPGTIMVLPTAPCIAPLVETSAEGLNSFRVRVMQLTVMSGLSGLPQITIPAGTVDGCPVGMSLLGWAGGDEALLDLAVTLSKYCGVVR